jgi:septal ring factor EnvC (AmiA/AmiB activator)
MKKTAILLLVLITLFSCKNESKEYDKIYNSWKGEMAEIKKGHTETLSILDSFEQKIDDHKKRLKEFTTFIDAETSKGTENVSKLEEDIVNKANVNIKKHEHFLVFLNNLSALQGTFDNKPFELSIIPDESAITKFNSLNEATSFWINEKNNINDGHNKALSIIEDLKNHIHYHQKEIKEFTQKIEEAKKGKKAVSELEDNYNSNKNKHEHFVGLLANLKQVQRQFEGN